jgi:hypothetical protein
MPAQCYKEALTVDLDASRPFECVLEQPIWQSLGENSGKLYSPAGIEGQRKEN